MFEECSHAQHSAILRLCTLKSPRHLHAAYGYGHRKPSRNVEAELLKELNTFVTAVLQEYSNLFGAEVPQHGKLRWYCSCEGVSWQLQIGLAA